MSEIKPVYQQRREWDEWEDIPKDTYDMRVNGKYQVRILYPAADYEALKEKLARLNGLYHSEVSKHQLDYNALKAENEAQSKRIEELEAGVVDIRDWTARWTRPDHPIVTVANRLLPASKNGDSK